MRSHVLALLMATSACGGATPPPAAPSAPADVVAATKGIIEQWRQAYELRDVEVLSKLYAHDLDVSLTVDGTTSQGWTAVEDALKAKLARASAIHARVKDTVVVALPPDAASTTSTLTREISVGDGAQTETESGTLSLVLRRTTMWTIISEHYSYRRGQ